MYDYFIMLESEAKLDKKEYSIKDLTLEIANRAGYHRKLYTFKNGTERIRTMYDREFDSVLSAKWILFYKPLFIAKLASHPEFDDRRVDIINNTFMMVMNCLKVDKVVDDDVVNRYTNLALSGRIKNELIEMGSLRRLEDYENGKKLNMRLKNASLNQAYSLDKYMEDNDGECPLYSNDNLIEDEFLSSITDKLEDNPFGVRLLSCMLSNGKKVHMSRIDEYMDIKDEEKTEETKRLIGKAYFVIKEALKGNVDNRYKYDFSYSPEDIVGFSK